MYIAIAFALLWTGCAHLSGEHDCPSSADLRSALAARLEIDTQTLVVGDSYRSRLILENAGAQPVGFCLLFGPSVGYLMANREQPFPLYLSGSRLHGCDEKYLAPGESLEVPFVVQVPRVLSGPGELVTWYGVYAPPPCRSSSLQVSSRDPISIEPPRI